ncbi:MAG: GNAT family N-acetyltransferase [Clostridia bacterium]
MVRVAQTDDAVQLEMLNNEFNGKGETSLENIRKSLLNNEREIVVVYCDRNLLVGFTCVQLKKSFCYDDYMPEITEVYVKVEYRNRGIATAMITFAEDYCKHNFGVHEFELLTGENNNTAQKVYQKIGYAGDGEIHLSKRVR